MKSKENIINQEIINKIEKEYFIKISKIQKNGDSTEGNVYNIYTPSNKYILKLYNDFIHVKRMINIHNKLQNEIYIPIVIFTKNKEKYLKLEDEKYIIIYSFLNGTQLQKLNIINETIIKNLASNLRKIHELTKGKNELELKELPFFDYNIERKSALHFDITKANIFYNDKIENKIGFIDFDDAKYGPSICDVAIAIGNLFFSKNRGVNLDAMNVFIQSYYEKNIELKEKEVHI